MTETGPVSVKESDIIAQRELRKKATMKLYAAEDASALTGESDNALQRARLYHQAVRDIGNLTMVPHAFGTYTIGGFVKRSPMTGELYPGGSYDVSVTTSRVRRIPQSGGAGYLSLQAKVMVNGLEATLETSRRVLDSYVQPLKDRNAIKRQMFGM